MRTSAPIRSGLCSSGLVESMAAIRRSIAPRTASRSSAKSSRNREMPSRVGRVRRRNERARPEFRARRDRPRPRGRGEPEFLDGREIVKAVGDVGQKIERFGERVAGRFEVATGGKRPLVFGRRRREPLASGIERGVTAFSEKDFGVVPREAGSVEHAVEPGVPTRPRTAFSRAIGQEQELLRQASAGHSGRPVRGARTRLARLIGGASTPRRARLRRGRARLTAPCSTRSS